MGLELDLELLEGFERQLDPRHPESGSIPASILGYGEITTVFEIGAQDKRRVAYKRLPVFRDLDELDRYLSSFDEYCRLLTNEVGLKLVPYGHANLTGKSGRPVLFLAQEKVEPLSFCHKAIHLLPREEVLRLVRAVLGELSRVWEFNRADGRVEIGLDGQISNWSIKGFNPSDTVLPERIELIYFDTSTPLFRVDGAEQLDPELFLRSAPSFLVWLIRLLFLEDVMTRYYDLKLVTIDLIANFYKEQLPERIGDLVELANDFFAGEAAELGVEPITVKEVRSYYREDALIWILYLSARKLDRFMRTRVLRGDYPYILPGKIKR